MGRNIIDIYNKPAPRRPLWQIIISRWEFWVGIGMALACITGFIISAFGSETISPTDRVIAKDVVSSMADNTKEVAMQLGVVNATCPSNIIGDVKLTEDCTGKITISNNSFLNCDGHSVVGSIEVDKESQNIKVENCVIVSNTNATFQGVIANSLSDVGQSVVGWLDLIVLLVVLGFIIGVMMKLAHIFG
jgi:hypothetical protein